MWKELSKKMENLFIHYEEMVTDVEKPISTKHKGQPSPQYNLVSKINKCSHQLTNRSGMIFLPSTTSTKGPCPTDVIQCLKDYD